MFIKSGDVISISHYSNAFQMKSIVMDVVREISDDVICVKISSDYNHIDFLEGDPVVLGLERDKKIYLTSCQVISISTRKGILKLALNNEEFVINNRAHERYPVSLYADVKNIAIADEFVAIIKNISYNGLMLCARKEVAEGEALEIRFYFEGIEIFVGAKIMWRMSREIDYEYGLKITYMDYNSQTLLNNYIEKLKIEQEEFIRRLREE